MSDPRPSDRPQITLEHLLELKRAERPAPAFWEEFDRELHRRQLACVVDRPSWSVRLGRSLLIGVRRAVPIGAAATAAIGGFVVLQQRPDASPTPQVTTVVAPVQAEPTVVATQSDPLPEPALQAVEQEIVAEPRFIRPTTSEPRYRVHEFATSSSPARTFVSVTSPNTFSLPAYEAALQTVNTLSSSTGGRASTHAAPAGSF
jgi:hypothetical protein